MGSDKQEWKSTSNKGHVAFLPEGVQLFAKPPWYTGGWCPRNGRTLFSCQFLHCTFSFFPLSLIRLLPPPRYSTVPWFFSSSSWAAAGTTVTWTCKLLSPATPTSTAKQQSAVACTWEMKGCCRITHPPRRQNTETRPNLSFCANFEFPSSDFRTDVQTL